MTGGDLIEIRWTHKDLGSGVVFCKAGEDSTFNLGGYVASDDSNGIDGGGRMIDVLNRQRWSLSATVAWDMVTDNELKKLQELQSSTLLADFTIDHIGGTIWSGNGKPVGELPGNGGNATIPLKLSGGGKLQKV